MDAQDLLVESKKNLNPKKIITHSGIHHRDEVTAIALLNILYNTQIPIERKKKEHITQEEYNDPHIILIDIGGEYDTNKNNYDHHQDQNSPASNILIINHFLKTGIEKNTLKYDFFSKLSFNNITGGLHATHHTDSIGIIIDHNNRIEDGFINAIEFAKVAIKTILLSAQDRYAEKQIFDKFERIEHNGIKIIVGGEGSNKIIDRKVLSNDLNEIIYISPSNQNPMNMTIRSKDIEIFQIVNDDSIKNKTHFIHPNKFYGEYTLSKEEILEYIKSKL